MSEARQMAIQMAIDLQVKTGGPTPPIAHVLANAAAIEAFLVNGNGDANLKAQAEQFALYQGIQRANTSSQLISGATTRFGFACDNKG